MLIGLTGCARAGKDTVADYLVQHHGFQKRSIAYPLKEICKILFDWTDDQVNGDAKDIPLPDTGIRPREILQFVGTELFRTQMRERFPEIGGDIWINHLTRTLCRHASNVWVVPDVRFPNEARQIRDLGGWIIQVKSPRDNTIPDSMHISELSQNQIIPDFTLYNFSDKDYLYAQARMILGRFDNPKLDWRA